MRRFGSSAVVSVGTPGGGHLHAWVAQSHWTRLAGLAGVRRLPPGEAVLLPRCRSVHTVGMLFRVDVAFVSWPPVGRECRVVALASAVGPGRLVSARGRVAALESGAGTLTVLGAVPGAVLRIDPAADLCQAVRPWVRNRCTR
jgi:hypothetical protein